MEPVTNIWGMVAAVAVVLGQIANGFIQRSLSRKADAVAEEVKHTKEEVAARVEEKLDAAAGKQAAVLGEIYVRINGRLEKAEDVIRALTRQLEHHGIVPRPEG